LSLSFKINNLHVITQGLMLLRLVKQNTDYVDKYFNSPFLCSIIIKLITLVHELDLGFAALLLDG
jgi:hypothetical protein